MPKTIVINNNHYQILELLGKGKGGYSYLVSKDNDVFVAKQIHHEPCDYYQFSNKIESEINAYKTLVELGIRVPKLIEVDKDKEILLKEYILGETIDRYVLLDKMKSSYIEQVMKMQEVVKAKGYNLDYYPTNFVVNDDLLYYIDYELNEYFDEWNFQNWGSKYWSKTNDFIKSFVK